jgi:hypothetical protein
MTEKTDQSDHKGSHHIAGIYNYCDRWCERCPFTSRCLNFEMSGEKFGDLESQDISNDVFWQKLSETLQETMAMLKEMVAERGIDLDSIEIDDDDEPDSPFEDKAVVHMTTHMARAYMDIVEDWFNDNGYILEDDLRHLAGGHATEGSDSHSTEDTVSLVDSVEVIRWYQHQIFVKLQRAIHSSRDEEFEIEHGFPKDSDGSAKVALIGMDRSLGAWGKMIRYFPDQKQNMLDVINHLDRLRRQTEKKFPAARAFMRPGFDEIGIANPGDREISGP